MPQATTLRTRFDTTPAAVDDVLRQTGLDQLVSHLPERLDTAAHRLSTVSSADQLVVLDRGKVRATGTHAELVAGDALYRELATTQLLESKVD